MSNKTFRRNELYSQKDNQPICTFFEYFIASQDPDYELREDGEDLVYPFCHMIGNPVMNDYTASECLGDYLKCPIAYGKSKIIVEAPANPA